MRQLLLFPGFPPTVTAPPPLTVPEQEELLEGLLHGGSPQVLCRRMGRGAESFSRTMAEDASFRRRLSEVRELMTDNVLARLYRAALEGGASAQGLWLKTYPPPANFESTSPTEKDDDREPISEQDLRDWAECEKSLREPTSPHPALEASGPS